MNPQVVDRMAVGLGAPGARSGCRCRDIRSLLQVLVALALLAVAGISAAFGNPPTILETGDRVEVDRNNNGLPDIRKDLPLNAPLRWDRIGLSGAPPDFKNILNVKQYGATGNGTTDDTFAINAAILQAPDRSVVYLPAGTYRLTQPLYLKPNMILRGAGPVLTSLLFEGTGTLDRCIGIIRWDGQQTTIYVTPTAGMDLGSTELTVLSVSDFRPGDLIEIEEDNDPAWNLNDGWQQRLAGQINRLRTVDTVNLRLGLDRPLRHGFSLKRNPRLRRLNAIENVGLENLFIRRMDPVNGYTIEMKYAVRCWVRNVESYKTYKAHVWMDRAYECEVRQSYFHDSYVLGREGQGYGVGSGKRTSDCLVEDNVFRQLRHSMIVGIGANGNVYGFNYSTDRAIDPVNGTVQADLSVHGNYVFMNLFEGNIVEDADVPDWYWPLGPGNTLFRNRITNIGTAISVGSSYQNFIGNVLTRGTLTLAKSLEGIIDCGNVKQGDTQNVSWVGCPSRSLPDSLYHRVPPDFILNAAGVSWPPIGPDKPLDSETPSQQRYSSGQYLP